MALDVDLASGGDTPTPAREPTLARILAALRGLGERRAVVALLVAALAGALVGGILTVAVSIFGSFVAVLAGLVVALAMAAGMHAAGLLQMDAERGIGQRGVLDALAQGLQALPLLIAIGAAALGAVAVVLIAVALLLALTKLPFLGPLLFVVVFPLSIVAVGLTVAGATVAVAFAMGALWQGATLFRAVAQTLVVLRRRTVPTLARFAALGFLVAASLSVVFGVLSLGFAPVAALSATIVGVGGAAGADLAAGTLGVAQGGHVAAGVIGGLLLWAGALSVVAQVWLRGVCGLYLDMSEGVDASASEAHLRDRMEDARRRTGSATSTAPVAAAAMPLPVPPEPVHAGGTPPWEESTSPSMSAADTLSAPGDYERLQRAAFGESAPARPMPPVPRAASPADAAPSRPDDDDDATLPPPAFAATGPTASAPTPATASTSTPAFAPTSVSAPDIDLLLDADPTPSAPTAPQPAARPSGCPACSAETSPDDIFCNRCGHRLAGAT